MDGMWNQCTMRLHVHEDIVSWMIIYLSSTNARKEAEKCV